MMLFYLDLSAISFQPLLSAKHCRATCRSQFARREQRLLDIEHMEVDRHRDPLLVVVLEPAMSHSTAKVL